MASNLPPKTLLDNLPYEDYKAACEFTREQCCVMAKLADIKLLYKDNESPGKTLMDALNRRGISVQRFHKLKQQMLNHKMIYYRPSAKVAILIGNDSYQHLSRLITPLTDCESVATILRALGFITVIVKNSTSETLKDIVSSILSVVPEDSYCFIFYAGHGCELCNTKCILSVDCPTNNLELHHCVTENWLLSELSKGKPDLCILIMDMCRNMLDRDVNKPIFDAISSVENYTIHKNLLMVCSSAMGQSSYEENQMEYSKSLDTCSTIEIQTGDLSRILPGASQYVFALCKRLNANLDICTLLDKVHEDAATFSKKQTPIKVQCGTAKRSLYDIVKGDMTKLFTKLQEATEKYKETISVRFDYRYRTIKMPAVNLQSNEEPV